MQCIHCLFVDEDDEEEGEDDEVLDDQDSELDEEEEFGEYPPGSTFLNLILMSE